MDRAIRSVGGEPANIVPLSGASADLPSKLDLRALHQTVRWFHIDGEHTGTAVYRELELANRITSPQGIVVVDDFFNPRYPANTTEVVRYLEKNPFHFRLLMVGFNKAYLCRPESLPRYMDFMLDGMPKSMRKYGWRATVYKTTGPWDMDAVGMEMFIDAAGISVGPDDDPQHWHMMEKRHVWSPWRHVRERIRKTIGI
ncbi:MAG: class I SAM-dependent methyltransferase [Alphaproteobacteria bacterium]|nr:class I SAM-dependent methyltransferase [Alphaproteobacteria bacterium]